MDGWFLVPNSRAIEISIHRFFELPNPHFPKMKKYPYTILITLVILILSLMPVPEMPLSQVRFIDKWTHILMYFGLTSAFWLDYCRLNGLRLFQKRALFFAPRGLQVQQLDSKTSITWALVYPILLGGLMELMQAYCTNGMRSGDWIDWIADAVGSIVGYGFCALLVRLYFPRR